VSERPGGPCEAMCAGWRTVRDASPRVKLLLLLFFLLTLLMLPAGRGTIHEIRRAGDPAYLREADGGGILAPLAFDSGYNFRLRPGADFFAIYEAGIRARTGGDPYTAGLEAPRRAPYATQFRYPVFTAYWLGAPLSLLPPWVAYGGWVAACIAMIVANFLLCVGRAPSHVLPFALLWFAWFPVVPELHMGQFSLFVATLLLWGADALLVGRRWAGVPWMLAMLVKVFPLAWLPVVWRMGRRRAAIVATLVLFASAGLTIAIFPAGRSEGILSGGIFGKVIAKTHQPYAGAQGLQSAINAIVWKISGKGLVDASPETPTPHWSDATLIISLVVILAYTVFAVWGIMRMRGDDSAGTKAALLGILWLSWFIAFRDNWEHHYVLVQALAALLLARGVVTPRQTLLIWIFAGTPSLWYLWQKLGPSTAGEVIGLAYFLQRPIGLGVLLWTMGKVLIASREACTFASNSPSKDSQST